MSAVQPVDVARPHAMDDRFTAWRIGAAGIAIPFAISPASLDEAVAAAALCCDHKQRFVIRETDGVTGESRVHFYEIRRESKRKLRRDPLTGADSWQQNLYPVHLFTIQVGAFEPVEPWKWEPGCDPVGLTPRQMKVIP